jgi:glycosyltransferase involved in cell wall biosynthesis
MVANFAAGTGYAWDMIESYFAGLGRSLAARGLACHACYPDLPEGTPAALADSPVAALRFDYSRTAGLDGMLEFMRLLRRHQIRALYLTDRGSFSPRYVLFRLAGVRHIIVHDHTSGARTRPRGAKRLLKRLLNRTPWLSADLCLGVSDYVHRRLTEINGVPPRKARRLYNGLDLTRFASGPTDHLHRLLGLPPEIKLVLCCCRANTYKGVPVLMEAASLLLEQGRRDLAFVHCGDGPELAAFKAKAREMGLEESFFFLGQRRDVDRLLPCATVAAVPSVWEEAFGLTVIEAMAAGVPVVASRVGGIPELIEPEVTGLLVEPGNVAELAAAIARLADDDALRRTLTRRASHLVAERFSLERSIAELSQVVGELLLGPERRTTARERVQVAGGAR